MNTSPLQTIRQIKSYSLRKIAEQLVMNRFGITFYGQAWTNTTADWIYFDTVLDIDSLKKEFNLGDNFIVHENLDPKSGTERGVIDINTGEGLMGKL